MALFYEPDACSAMPLWSWGCSCVPAVDSGVLLRAQRTRGGYSTEVPGHRVELEYY